jgi:hypothetical protein
MTKDQIEAVLERVKTWPRDQQELAAQVLLDIEANAKGEVYELTDEERADLDAAIEAADRDEFVSDEEMAAFFTRIRR